MRLLRRRFAGKSLGFALQPLVLLVAWGSPVAGQEEDEQSPYRPGLVATYAVGDKSATRTDEVLAFDWQDAACEARLPAGDFQATWRGRLWARGSGTYAIHCYVQGEVAISVAGKKVITGNAPEPQWLVSQPLELEFDYHPMEITFRKTQASAQLALFWSGPDFQLEPVPARALVHEREMTPAAEFERGRQLAAALRCGACHANEVAIAPAPALDRLPGNIAPSWVVDWLSSHTEARGNDGKGALRRMPDLAMTRAEAEAIAAWLLREPAKKVEQKKVEQKETKGTKSEGKSKKGEGKGGKKAREEKPQPSVEEGERLILTRGCLGCHQLGPLGESGLFGGGDLTDVGKKRPSYFLARWLADPAAINRHHRMPVFTFTADELASLALWAKAQDKRPVSDTFMQRPRDLSLGEGLVKSLRCAACHAVTGDQQAPQPASLSALTATSNWSQSCTGPPERSKQRPGYRLTAQDQAALKAYYSQARPGQEKLSPQARGRDLLVQHNCLACHQREGIERATNALPALLQDKLVAVAEAHGELAPLVPAMTPPALNSVGDKLLDAALVESISREGKPHRPYLLVQMPKFKLTKYELASLTAYFTATDRIPRSPHAPREEPTGNISRSEMATLLAAGPRLVTTDGLACTSCHAVGSVQPAKAPLNARGPDLSMLEKRIRREWFDRWCDNPARIVPRMEMPSVKVPVRGVLNDNVKDQLAAVWHILNTPGFEPPEPNPVRTLRLSGVPGKNERPIVLHDVVKDGDKTYLFPLVIGLPNRHNVLFDLETNRLAAWWLGDTARQRTKGKSWYWEMGGKSIFEPGFSESEISVWIDGKERFPEATSQLKSELSVYSTRAAAPSIGHPADVDLILERRFPTTDTAIANGGKSIKVGGIDTFRVGGDQGSNGAFTRLLRLVGYGDVNRVRLRLVNEELARAGKWDEATHTFHHASQGEISIRVITPRQIIWNGDGTVFAADHGATKEEGLDSFHRLRPQKSESPTWRVYFILEYRTALSADQHLVEPLPILQVEPSQVSVAPGFLARRLALSADLMPSAMTWNESGDLIVATLKGEVQRAADSNGDGEEDQSQMLTDGLATPYGIHAKNEFIYVAAKDALLRLQSHDDGRNYSWVETVASGWGHTDDYHDWAVGLIPGDNGEYFVALPCQQDQRSDAAASLRGKFLKLVPREATRDNPRLFDIEVISSGHRFPMGMARNREGELFVTDNQGNYNPFNELNHVRKGAHFGFINALEKTEGFKAPPLSEPAIDIPHPWTRSVNGICFLETPKELKAKLPLAERADHIYGPLEGHLIGCEYDTRRLIRMSLQKVGDTYQGCAYPLSIPTEDVEKGLLGPIVCAIKPTTGELYVGEIRDSGWGAANNIGQIVKIKIEPEKLPCGIAEVRATHTGFTVDFFQPVDRTKAAELGSYSIASYRRESTPAYGGSDIDRRTERVNAAEVSTDGKRVTLSPADLRAGHLYELKLKNLTPGGGMFHPDEAHYTLRRIPE